MNPRHAILLEAGVSSLTAMATALELPIPKDPDRAKLVALLTGAPGAHAEFLLRHLAEDEVRQVAAACGLLRGGDLEAVRARIAQRAAFDPADEKARRPTRRRRGAAVVRASWRYDGRPFVALDFETADRGRDSACSVALVRAEDGEIVETRTRLIRPPRKRFEFTHIHGLRWSDVEDQPRFEEVWPELEDMLEGAAFLAAHNAPFDRGVLEACCERAHLAAPSLPYRCTVRLAKQTWHLRRNRLPDVCAHLGIELQHHDATSDAQACARIVLASARP